MDHRSPQSPSVLLAQVEHGHAMPVLCMMLPTDGLFMALFYKMQCMQCSTMSNERDICQAMATSNIAALSGQHSDVTLDRGTCQIVAKSDVAVLFEPVQWCNI